MFEQFRAELLEGAMVTLAEALTAYHSMVVRLLVTKKSPVQLPLELTRQV